MRAAGVDVSSYRPVRDWDALVGSGCTFLGARATMGNHELDATFRQHRDGLRAHPELLLGLYYHYAYPGDPEHQAERMIDVVGELAPNEQLVLDIERLVVEAAHQAEWIDVFLDTLEHGTGRPAMLYTSARIWNEMGDPAFERAARTPLWLPRYNDVGNEPNVPPPWAALGLSWDVWQWSDGGGPHGTGPDVVTPGVGHCDVNWWAGDVDALRAYVAELAACG